MTKTKIRVALLLAALALFAATPAAAQNKPNPPTPKIAILDVQAILREAVAAKSVREQMDAMARDAQAEISAEEQKLRKRDAELQQQRSLLTPEVYSQRQQQLRSDIAALQKRARDLRLALDNGFKRTMDQIQLVLLDEVRKLTTEFDVNLVLSQSQIVLAVDAYDITQPALERLNKRLPSVELTLHKNDTGDKAK